MTIWIAVVAYIMLALALGWRAHRRSVSGAAYWTAGRTLGVRAVGFSMSAGFLSVSWASVYGIQLFYWYGLGGAWLITIPWLLELAAIYWLSRRYHALPAFSQPEMVGLRFGSGARRAVAAAIAFVFLAWGGAEVYVAATLLAPGLGISVSAAIIGASSVVGIYATLGGFRAIVDTDQVQYVLVTLFMLAVAGLAWHGLREAELGWEAFAVEGVFSGAPWHDPFAPGFALIVVTFIAYIPAGTFQTDLWLRMQAARDARTARRGMLFTMVTALIFVGLVPAFIALAALNLFPVVDGATPAILGTDGDTIITALVSTFAPPWLIVLIALGLVAAAMSTIDTCVNVMALSLGYDLLRLDAAQGARAAAWVTVVATVATCIFALNTASLWDVFYLSGGVLTAAVAFPVAAVMVPGVRPRAVLASSLAGFCAILVGYGMQRAGWLSQLQPAWLEATGLGYIVWGVGVALIAAGMGQLGGRRGDL